MMTKLARLFLRASVPTFIYKDVVFWLLANVKTSISREGTPSNQKGLINFCSIGPPWGCKQGKYITNIKMNE